MFFFILGFGSVFFGLGLGLVLVGESLELPDTRALLLAAVGEGFLNQDHVRDVFVIELLKVVVVEIGHGEVVSLGNRFFLKKRGGGGHKPYWNLPKGTVTSLQDVAKVGPAMESGVVLAKIAHACYFDIGQDVLPQKQKKNGVGVQVKQHEYKLPCREWGRAARHQGPRTR